MIVLKKEPNHFTDWFFVSMSNLKIAYFLEESRLRIA